jgi:type I restriction enzyme M protein
MRLAKMNLAIRGIFGQIELGNSYYDDKFPDLRADFVLANPPFMTPKGGIRPHKKFGVQANKAEVLFTDYIAEHLNSNGRAGIVVPNGIVATSQTAYKQLRKMLVQDSLIAVISLPAGVFQPYSGVKTSVLILDKRLAKISQHILFLKIENDGFDLGAQRREIDKNDLPTALAVITNYKLRIANDEPLDEMPSLATLVEKEIVLGNKDVVLSAERYFEKAISQTEFNLVKLADVCKVINGRAYKQDELLDKGKYLVLRVGNFFTNKSWYYSDLELPDDKYCDNGDLLYAWSASFGPKMWDGGKVIYHYHIWKMVPDETVILKKYLYFVLEKETERMKAENTNGSTMLHLTKEGIEQLEIPLPPLEIQQQIVTEIESYQKIIDGAKQIVNNYKPTIKINPDWEMVELDKVCKIQSGGTPSKAVKEYWENGTVPWVGSTVCKDQPIFSCEEYITELGLQKSSAKIFPKHTTLIALVGATIGKTAYLEFETSTNQNIAGLQPLDNTQLDNKFLFFISQTLYNQFYKLGDGSFRMASLSFIKELQIPLPSIEEQQSIVQAIEEEMQLVNTNKRLIEIFEQKIKTKIGEVWGVVPEPAEGKEEVETI